MNYFKLAVTALSGASLLTKVLIGAGAGAVLLTALLGAYGVWHHKVFRQGEDAAIAGIAREDTRYLSKALLMRGTFKTCRDQGRQWDQATGRCL